MANAKKYNDKATLAGVQVQQMLQGGQEVIIGAVTDPSFGKLVAFGLGGILVEVLKDATFRLAPATKDDALSMLDGIAAAEMLKGVRGAAGVNRDALATMIQRVSELVSDFPEISELDLNPVFATEKGATAADVRIVIDMQPAPARFRPAHDDIVKSMNRIMHLLGRAVRRRDHVDPVQHTRRALVGGNDIRRLSDGAAGTRGRGDDGCVHVVVRRRVLRRRDDHVPGAADRQVRAALRSTRVLRRPAADVLQLRGHAAPFDTLACFDGAAPVDNGGRLWRRDECWLTRPNPRTTVGPADVHALDDVLLKHVASAQPGTPDVLLLVEDSAGHVVSRAAEMRFQSQFLAHHAAVLGLLRAQGRRLVGLLTGVGHSAAFFSNAMQASTLYALSNARVVAMEPASIVRITGLPAGTLIEDDPLLGQPVRHLMAQGGVAAIVPDASIASLGL